MPIYYSSIGKFKTLILLTYIPLGSNSIYTIINLTCLLYSLNTKAFSIFITIFITLGLKFLSKTLRLYFAP